MVVVVATAETRPTDQVVWGALVVRLPMRISPGRLLEVWVVPAEPEEPSEVLVV